MKLTPLLILRILHGIPMMTPQIGRFSGTAAAQC
jgi:hypothetical protein